MTVRRLDDNGDIVTSGVQFINGKEEVAQTIRTRLRLFLGEYFRNVKDGTPWYQSILTKKGSLSSKDAIIKGRISKTPDVVQILSYNASFVEQSRVYSISVTVLTTFGVIEITEQS